MNAAASSCRTCRNVMRSCRCRSASMMPLIPSPGRPKTIFTPQSINRSTSTSAVVMAMGRLSVRFYPASLLPLENPRDRADELFPQRPVLPAFSRDLAASTQIGLQIRADPRDGLRIPERHVHLVVVLERAVVEVGR